MLTACIFAFLLVSISSVPNLTLPWLYAELIYGCSVDPPQSVPIVDWINFTYVPEPSLRMLGC
jgi:hypothetical protein